MLNQQIRFGLTEANYRRFESIIHAAISSYPTPVEVDWTTSDLRYITFITRFRDALLGLRRNLHWGSEWLTEELVTRLNALEVRPHATRSVILVGDHESVKTPLPQINANVEAVALAQRYTTQFTPANPAPIPATVESFRSVLSIGADSPYLERAVKAYAELASFGMEGLGKLTINRRKLSTEDFDEKLLELLLKEWTSDYDVAIQTTDNEYTIF